MSKNEIKGDFTRMMSVEEAQELMQKRKMAMMAELPETEAKVKETPKKEETQESKEDDPKHKKLMGAFVEHEGKYVFASNVKRVAFVDHKERLATRENAGKAIEAMVSMAEKRGWQSVNITGNKEFRRNVWLEASTRGIDVHGFEPKTEDHLRLKARLQEEKKLLPNKENEVAKRQTPSEEKKTQEEKVPWKVKEKRTYLEVPYEEKSAAKEAGAHWDKEKKAWYLAEAGTKQKETPKAKNPMLDAALKKAELKKESKELEL